MNLEILSTFFLGAIVGASIGTWRTWAFSRKLIHLGVSLDQWSDYCESTMQAVGQSRAKNDAVAALRQDGADESGMERHQNHGDVMAAVASAWGSGPASRMRRS